VKSNTLSTWEIRGYVQLGHITFFPKTAVPAVSRRQRRWRSAGWVWWRSQRSPVTLM